MIFSCWMMDWNVKIISNPDKGKYNAGIYL
jgi:hypothetical protein